MMDDLVKNFTPPAPETISSFSASGIKSDKTITAIPSNCHHAAATLLSSTIEAPSMFSNLEDLLQSLEKSSLSSPHKPAVSVLRRHDASGSLDLPVQTPNPFSYQYTYRFGDRKSNETISSEQDQIANSDVVADAATGEVVSEEELIPLEAEVELTTKSRVPSLEAKSTSVSSNLFESE